MGDTGTGKSGDKGHVSRLQMILFAFPALPHAFIVMPVNIVIPAFYAGNTEVTLALIALVTTITRLADAVIDPLIGYLSDRTRSRMGPRKPWVLSGALLCAISIFFLFQPPADANWIYYAVWSFGLYFGFTLFEIPRNAWGAELSRDYFVRARIGGWVSVFNIAGSLVFWLTPVALAYFIGTTEIGAPALSVIAWLYVILMPAGMALAMLFVPAGQVGHEKLSTIRNFLGSLRENRLLLRFFAVIATWGLGQGAFLSVMLIFISDYLQLGAIFPFIMICFFVVQIASMSFWLKVVEWIGKGRTWGLSLITGSFAPFLMLLLEPGPQSLWPLLLLASFNAFLIAPQNFTPNAVLGDVIDYDIMKRKANNAGNIFALNVLIVKATMAVGTGFAFWILDAFAYKVGGPNTDSANNALLFAYLVFPGAIHVVSGLIVWGFPLDSKKHATIRRRIERRAAPMALSPAE